MGSFISIFLTNLFLFFIAFGAMFAYAEIVYGTKPYDLHKHMASF